MYVLESNAYYRSPMLGHKYVILKRAPLVWRVLQRSEVDLGLLFSPRNDDDNERKIIKEKVLNIN